VAGRPSKLTKQVEADLTLLLAKGVPIKLAAAATDVSPRSVRRWLHEGDLRERVAEVRAAEPTPADAADEARLVVLTDESNRRLRQCSRMTPESGETLMGRTAVSVRLAAGLPVALVDHARAERSGFDQV
jgi:hypothetical protein